MEILINKPYDELSYCLPTNEDFDFIKQLLKNDLYKFVKSTYDINDIIDHKSLLPFPYSSNHNDLEFNYVISNKQYQNIGYIKGYYPLSKNTLWIQILAVNTPFIRQGYGKLIVKELIQHILINNSITNIYLTCHNHNVIGIKFWESLGFTKLFNIKSTYGLFKTDLRSLTCIPSHLKP